MRPHPTFWLARWFRFVEEYRATLLADSFRWPETRIPRTDNPADFRTLTHRHF